MKLAYDDKKAEEVEKIAKQSFETIPNGVYEIRLDDVTTLVDKVAGQPDRDRGFSLVFLVTDGDFKARKVWKNAYLEPVDAQDDNARTTLLGMFSGFLDDCGIGQTERHEFFKKGSTDAGIQPADIKQLFAQKFFKVQLESKPSTKNPDKIFTNIKKVVEVRNDSNAF